MKACTTNVARSMGYLSAPSKEEEQYGVVVALGPMSAKPRSYHVGKSSASAYLEAVKALGVTRRSRRRVLYATN